MGRAVESLQRNGWGRNPLKAAPETLRWPRKAIVQESQRCTLQGTLRGGACSFPTLEFQNNSSVKAAPELRGQLQSAQNCPEMVLCAASTAGDSCRCVSNNCP